MEKGGGWESQDSADRVRGETEVGGASPWSSPNSAAGGCAGARTPTGSSHTAPCCRCHDPGYTHTHTLPWSELRSGATFRSLARQQVDGETASHSDATESRRVTR